MQILGDTTEMHALVERAIVSAEANSAGKLRGDFEAMARRRYQRGHLRLRGTREKVWVGMWREDVVTADGTIRRVRKSEVLGNLKDYKTRRLAERVLEQRLSEVNSLTYKPRPTATFAEFAQKWQPGTYSANTNDRHNRQIAHD